jgi:hypothetical protein
MRSIGLCAAGALLLAGCQNADDPNRATTTTGANLGSAEWQTRYAEDRRIDLPARVDFEVQDWKYRQLPQRYQEYMEAQSYWIMLETLHGYNGFRSKASESEFRKIFQQSKWVGQPLPVSEWRIQYDYPVQYATFEMDGQPCIAVVRPLGERLRQYYKSVIRGYGCGAADMTMNAYREQALGYVRDIDVDG